MVDLILIADNSNPEKPKKLRRLPKVSPRCPVCDSSVWMYVNLSPADREGIKPMRQRCCVHCLAKGKVTTW